MTDHTSALRLPRQQIIDILSGPESPEQKYELLRAAKAIAPERAKPLPPPRNPWIGKTVHWRWPLPTEHVHVLLDRDPEGNITRCSGELNRLRPPRSGRRLFNITDDPDKVTCPSCRARMKYEINAKRLYEHYIEEAVDHADKLRRGYWGLSYRPEERDREINMHEEVAAILRRQLAALGTGA